jgi:hypothetical protein
MVDDRASSNLQENLDHPLGPFLYGVSTMHCMTVSLAQGGEGRESFTSCSLKRSRPSRPTREAAFVATVYSTVGRRFVAPHSSREVVVMNVEAIPQFLKTAPFRQVVWVALCANEGETAGW